MPTDHVFGSGVSSTVRSVADKPRSSSTTTSDRLAREADRLGREAKRAAEDAARLTREAGQAADSAAWENAKAQENAAAFNARALLEAGQINAEILRYDSTGPTYQARMDADIARLNSSIQHFNADKASLQGSLQTEELLLRGKYALADAALAEKAYSRSSFEELKDRSTRGDQTATQIKQIQDASKRGRATNAAAYAAMGVSLDSAALDAIDADIAIQMDSDIAELLWKDLVADRVSGSRIKDLDTAAEDAVRLGDIDAFTFQTQATVVDLDAQAAALTYRNEAASLAESGDYMDWYSEFIQDSTELKATAMESGAQINADNAFSVGMANAAVTRNQGNVALAQSKAQAEAILGSYGG